jgi:hypothetical protein
MSPGVSARCLSAQRADASLCLVSVRRRAILMMAKGERPQPWLAYWRGGRLHDAADHGRHRRARRSPYSAIGRASGRRTRASGSDWITIPLAILILLLVHVELSHARQEAHKAAAYLWVSTRGIPRRPRSRPVALWFRSGQGPVAGF